MPKPTESAAVTPLTWVKVAPLSVEWKRPPGSPASQMSPSWPATALNWARVGRPLAPAVKLAPPSVLV